MLKNYLLTALRNIAKSKLFSIINIAGFAMGICVVMLMLYYIQFHLSFEGFHKNSSRLYRISIAEVRKGVETERSAFIPALGPDMQKDFPEIETYTRVRKTGGGTFNNNNKSYNISNVAWSTHHFLSFLIQITGRE